MVIEEVIDEVIEEVIEEVDEGLLSVQIVEGGELPANEPMEDVTNGNATGEIRKNRKEVKCPPIPMKDAVEEYVLKSHSININVSKLSFLPPLHQIQRIILKVQALENEYGHEFCILLNNVCVDLGAVRSLLLLHEIMNIECEVQQENDWFLKITSSLAQPLGTFLIQSALLYHKMSLE